MKTFIPKKCSLLSGINQFLSFVLFMNSKLVINSKNIKTRSPSTTAFAFCVVMNMRHLGSKESLGVKYKGDICTELCLKL